MTRKKNDGNPREPAKALWDHFEAVGGRCNWSGKVKLPSQDMIVEHWSTNNGQWRHYLVQLWADGSGWDVFAAVDDSNSNDVKATLDKIL